MPNPVKGEGVEIKINGQPYPLIFNFDAISKIESGYGKTILEVQAELPKITVLVDLLDAALVGFDDDLRDAEIPPLVETQMLIQKALHVAYYGTQTIEELTEDKTKKKTKS